MHLAIQGQKEVKKILTLCAHFRCVCTETSLSVRLQKCVFFLSSVALIHHVVVI